MIVICANCGKVFHQFKSWVRYKKTYCCRECFTNSLSKEFVFTCIECGKKFKRLSSLIKYKNLYCSAECYKARGAKVLIICDTCGKKFYRTPSKVNKVNYCSPACYYLSIPVTAVCTYCKKTFNKKNKKAGVSWFCSTECANKFKINKIPTTCATCGEIIFRIPSKIRRANYCSTKCYHGRVAQSGRAVALQAKG